MRPLNSIRSLLPEPMKIASFNINNINRRLPNLLSWLREAGPDIVCLQELKAADTEFPPEATSHGELWVKSVFIRACVKLRGLFRCPRSEVRGPSPIA